MELSIKERTSISFLLQILEKQSDSDNEKDQYSKLLQIVQNGFELDYDELSFGISENPLTAEQCQEVRDILAMYRSFHNAGVDSDEIKFEGYDGNDTFEARYEYYTSFLLGKRNLFQESHQPGHVYNSYTPMLETYRKQLVKWNALGGRDITDLSVDQVNSIVE